LFPRKKPTTFHNGLNQRQKLEKEAFFNDKFGTFCNILQHFGTFWNILEHFGIVWSSLEHFGIFCNIWEHVATFCNILQHFATFWNILDFFFGFLDFFRLFDPDSPYCAFYYDCGKMPPSMTCVEGSNVGCCKV
jgi:hypothetical protein